MICQSINLGSKITKRITLITLVLIMSLGLSSCREKERSIVIDYYFSCSPDLLRFVNPVISYTDENGVEKELVLQTSDFTLHNLDELEMEVTTNGNTVTVRQEFEDNRWNLIKHYQGWVVNDVIKISYRLKENIEIDEAYEYRFYDGIYNKLVKVYLDDKLVESEESTPMPVSLKLVAGRDVSGWLRGLCNQSYSFNVDVKADSTSSPS